MLLSYDSGVDNSIEFPYIVLSYIDRSAIEMVKCYPSTPRKPEQDSISDGGHNIRVAHCTKELSTSVPLLSLIAFSLLVL
jgi:hypothetical protein